MSVRPFEVVCEIEPPTRPDLKHVRHQIGVLSPVADAYLIPDNHIGRATVSGIAVAHEVGAMGGRSIACLNSRDRNLLGFRRDLLTAAAYGVSEFLFVYGDKPGSGGRTSDLTVRSMIEESRGCAQNGVFAGSPPWRGGGFRILRFRGRWLSGLLLTRLRVWVPRVSRLPGCVIAALSMVCIWCRFSVTARSRHAWKRLRVGLDSGRLLRRARFRGARPRP